jgi:hypothetical protein
MLFCLVVVEVSWMVGREEWTFERIIDFENMLLFDLKQN